MRKILVLLLLMWCIVPVRAAQIPRDLTDAIPDSAREFWMIPTRVIALHH